MISASNSVDDTGMRLPSWVLPTHDMQGYGVQLSVAETPIGSGDQIVALTGEFAGRTVVQITTPTRQ